MKRQHLFSILYIVIVAIICGAGTAGLLLNRNSPRILAQKEAAAAFDALDRSEATDTIREADFAALPNPVRRYLVKCGVVGRDRVRTFTGIFSGEMKLQEQMGWTRVHVVQQSIIDSNLTRIFYIKAKVCGALPVFGRDKYANGRGNMLIKLFGFIPVVNQSGIAMDRSELVTFLNDMALFPMAMLNPKVQWEPVNDTSARATLTDCGNSVSGILFFDSNDDLVNFVTDDRTFDDGREDVRKARWWTPFRNHRTFDGIRIPGEGDAEWDFGDHRFHYAHFHMDTIIFNPVKPCNAIP